MTTPTPNDPSPDRRARVGAATMPLPVVVDYDSLEVGDSSLNPRAGQLVMNTALALDNRPAIVYPDSDGQPMADNTKQFRCIVTIQGNLDLQFADDPNVFVGGDLFWYPVEGKPNIRAAPDVLVVFGRPKGDRGSYRQWEEGNIAPQVVFEILSPGNRPTEMTRKMAFYERYGVEEDYLYDQDNGELARWLRANGHFEEIASMPGWVSPRLQIRFELENGDLALYRPDGQRFLTFVELGQRAEQADQRAQQADQRAQEADQRSAAAEAEVARLRALLQQTQKPAGPT